MYSKELEELMDAVLADGVITEKERAVLHRRARQEGVDEDEMDIVIEGRLAALKNEENKRAEAFVVPQPSTMSDSTKPKSQKFGELNKCPNCNAVVQPGTAKCNECGYEFRNIDAVNSVQQFSNTLNRIQSRFNNLQEDSDEISPRGNAIVTAISNFPIPNTREDLLEFIIFTESKLKHLTANSATDHAIRKAYKAKYFESMEKAKIYFNNDPQFQHVFSTYEKNKRTTWKDLSKGARMIILGVLWFIFLILLTMFAMNYLE